ncbi:hypothetical protein BMA3051 [Burkholderia mallei ATCC 23344]|uniref:Uncharacterized protein n=1 Tax=Burkholderia mallei (strain ATCC 23344) TaxID=243160 RepID=A0A0H2WGA4_BURMA|nr:hypothetical protein BMA3051 [Burkholderia mallei ATCC 23344]
MSGDAHRSVNHGNRDLRESEQQAAEARGEQDRHHRHPRQLHRREVGLMPGPLAHAEETPQHHSHHSRQAHRHPPLSRLAESANRIACAPR